MVARVFGVGNHALVGLVLACFFGAATLTSLLTTGRTSAGKVRYVGIRRWPPAPSYPWWGVWIDALPVYIAGSVIAGAGFAMTFLGGLDEVSAVAPPAQRGQVFSAMVFILSYIAFSVPAVIAGLVVGTFGLRETVVGYVGYVLAVSLIGGVPSLGRTSGCGAPGYPR